MRKILTITMFMVLLSVFLKAQNNLDSIILDIRKNYSNIKSEIAYYDTSSVEIWGESTEGGVAIAYYNNDNKLRLIKVFLFGETGKSIFEYYYIDSKLFFAFYQKEQYNRPIYWDKKMMKEMGDNEFFDPKKSIIEEDRYYFYNQKLIKYLDNSKNEIDLSSTSNKLIGVEILKYSEKVRKMFTSR